MTNYEEWSFRMRAQRHADRLRYVEQRIGRWRALHMTAATLTWVAMTGVETAVLWYMLSGREYLMAALIVVLMFGALPILERAAKAATARRMRLLAREADAEAAAGE